MNNVILLGMVSFFIDLSTDMVYPLVPLYLTSALGATPALIGLIEGIAESLASLLRVFSGHISDKYQKKKLLAFTGYSASLIYKVALLLATSWFGILVARVIDRIGKGIRTAPRDVLVCESSQEDSLGKSFGIHKALDMAGSGFGILLAFIFLEFSQGGGEYKTIFFGFDHPCYPRLTHVLFHPRETYDDNKGDASSVAFSLSYVRQPAETLSTGCNFSLRSATRPTLSCF